MSNWGIEDSEEGLDMTTENSGPKALRDAYEAMKKQNRELQEGLQAVQGELQTQKVASTLSELGIPATAAQQYSGEADPEKVREWATTMQSIFGGGSGTPTAPTSTAPAPPVSTVSDEQAQQLQRMQESGQAGTPLGNMEAAASRIGDANDIQGLIAAWQGIK